MYRAPKFVSQKIVAAYKDEVVKNAPKPFQKKWRAMDFDQRLAQVMYHFDQAGYRGHEAEIMNIAEEYFWMGQKECGVVFPESAELCHRLIKAKFDIDTFHNPLHEQFAFMMPKDFELDGIKPHGIMVTIAPARQRERYLEHFNRMMGTNHTLTLERFTECLSVTYMWPERIIKDGNEYFSTQKANVPIDRIPMALRATTAAEWHKAVGQMKVDGTYDLSSRELEIQRKLFRLVMALIVYCQALPGQVHEGMPMPRSDSEQVKKEGKPLVVTDHTPSTAESKAAHYRTWHFATLRAERYYKGEFAHLPPGSRVIFKRPAMVNKDVSAITVS